MKNIHYILLFFCSTFAFAQNIFLTEVKATHNNTDKFLYQISNEPTSENQYLGKIEVSGYSDKDEEVFAEVYKKAKSIGGNTFSIKSPEQVDGTQVFNPAHYYIYVYYTEADKIAKEQNLIYIINPNKEVQLRINGVRASVQEVAALRSQDILRVEFFEDPGVRFGNENVGAVLNLIVDRQKNYGGYVFADGRNSPYVGFGNDNLTFKTNYKASEFGLNYFINYRFFFYFYGYYFLLVSTSYPYFLSSFF